MIERDVGDDADLRLNHISGVEPPAHADLEHRNIYFLSREVFKSDGGQHFEKAGMPWQFILSDEPLGGSVDHVVQQGKLVVADFFPIDSDALVDPNQMRRGVQARAYTGSLQDRSQGCCGRAFAIGPGNQNAGKSPLRMIECPEQYAHVVQVELGRWHLRQFVAQGVDSRNGSFVGHWQVTVSLQYAV